MPEWARAVTAWAVVLVVVSSASACRQRGEMLDVRIDPDVGRFPHASHRDTPCTDCHALASVLAGRPAVPGADAHAPCDRGECHQEAFAREPGPLCSVCHDDVDPTGAAGSPLAPYPPRRGGRAMASDFSHARHLDLAAMERAVGFHVSCSDCHPAGDDGRPGEATHAACARCHAPEAALAGVPSMAECERCHRQRPQTPLRERTLIQGDLRFRHASHTTDRRGREISCATCHPRSARATSVSNHPTPTTDACVDCHDDETRTPPIMRMQVCETCHATRARSFGSLPPRSHLPARELPDDHTLAFRRDHGDDAEKNATRCARCHTFMSGSSRDVCGECHLVMPPRDHTVTWVEWDHGPAAAARADRCATCHTTIFCTACHSQRPRSHIPTMLFREGGHATQARMNPRACIVCHEPTRDCTRSGCHTIGVPP